MEKENSCGLMVVSMMDNGKIIKGMVMELVLNMIMRNMKGIFKMICDKEKDQSIIAMEIHIKVIGIKIKEMDKVQ